VTAFPLRGTRSLARFPLTLLAVLTVVFIATVWSPPSGRLNWALEVGPGLLGIAALAAFFPRFPMSRWVYGCVFVHILILTYGAYYTYALTPLGDWAKETFHLARNHYDRVGHTALGFFPAFTLREVLLRQTPLQRGGWLSFIVISIALAIGAFYELIEWWSTLIFAADVGQAFLGSQGDVWDAQWDMLLAIVGSSLALAFFSKAHDRSMAKLGVSLENR
jgi:putative membrane protein